MPSAAEKSVEVSTTSENPLNSIVKSMEHKIRNLVKRKIKLTEYRQSLKQGITLTQDQREAVKKYDEVIHSLDVMQDLHKQFAQVAREANREAKRESKRNAFLKIQQESAKVREVLVIQDILRSLADDGVRQDFLDGANGAVKIEQTDMDLLEKLYVEVTPKRPTRSDEQAFVAAATHSANTLSSVIDATPKAFADSTCEHVRDILLQIQGCGYFEKDVIQVDEEESAEQEAEDGENDEAGKTETLEDETPESPNDIEAPAAKAVPAPEQLIQAVNEALPAPAVLSAVAPSPSPAAAIGANKDSMFPPIPPNTVAVRAVEYGLQKQYLQQQQQHQVAVAPVVRPAIHEVIGQGNFFFLQDSELEEDPIAVAAAQSTNAVVTQMPTQPSPQKPVQQHVVPPQLPAAALLPGTAPPNVLPPTTFNSQNYPNLVAPPQLPPPFAGADVPQPQHIPPPFAALLPSMVAPPVPNQVALAQPVAQIMQQAAAAVVQSPANDHQSIRSLPGFVQNFVQQQPPVAQQPPSRDVESPEASPTSNDWNDVNNRSPDLSNSGNGGHGDRNNSWNNDVDQMGGRGGYKAARGPSGGSSNTGYRSENKYNKYGGSDNKYPNSYRSRNNGGERGGGGNAYQNGNGGNRDVFFQNNDRSYYKNSNGANGGGPGGYKPRNDLMRSQRSSDGGGGGNNTYRSQRPGGPNNGPSNGRNGGDRDRGIKA